MPFTWAVCRLFHAVIMMGGERYVSAARRRSRYGPAVSCSSAGPLAYSPTALYTPSRLPRNYPVPYFLTPLSPAHTIYYRSFSSSVPALSSIHVSISRPPASFPCPDCEHPAQCGGTVPHGIWLHRCSTTISTSRTSSRLLPASSRLAARRSIIYAYREETRAVEQLTAAQQRLMAYSVELEKANTDLRRHNIELDEFNYVASHDLQEPLRKLIAFSDHLRKDLGHAPAGACGPGYHIHCRCRHAYASLDPGSPGLSPSRESGHEIQLGKAR